MKLFGVAIADSLKFVFDSFDHFFNSEIVAKFLSVLIDVFHEFLSVCSDLFGEFEHFLFFVLPFYVLIDNVSLVVFKFSDLECEFLDDEIFVFDGVFEVEYFLYFSFFVEGMCFFILSDSEFEILHEYVRELHFFFNLFFDDAVGDGVEVVVFAFVFVWFFFFRVEFVGVGSIFEGIGGIGAIGAVERSATFNPCLVFAVF